MLGLHPFNALFGAAHAPQTSADLATYMAALGSNGVHVLLCQPGSKVPWDLRTPKQRKDAEAEWEAADPATRPRSKDSLSGVHMATTASARLRAWARKAFKELGETGKIGEDDFVPAGRFPNIAVNIGASNALVIDADTPEEVAAFRAWAVERSGDPRWANLSPTVTSPGTKDGDEWKHYGGGHFWFSLPADANPVDVRVLPPDIRVEHGPGSFVAMLHSRYVLIPPSARPEGEYRVTGPALDAPPWLLDWLVEQTTAARERKQKQAERHRRAGLPEEIVEQIQDWYDDTPWSDLLTAIGWDETGTDGCGCPTWGRPGRSNPKSATAHQVGCNTEHYAGSSDPPIVFWTDNPGPEIQAKLDEVGGHTLSKMQFFSATQHEGKDAAAIKAATDDPAIFDHPPGVVQVSLGLMSVIGHDFEDYETDPRPQEQGRTDLPPAMPPQPQQGQPPFPAAGGQQQGQPPFPVAGGQQQGQQPFPVAGGQQQGQQPFPATPPQQQPQQGQQPFPATPPQQQGQGGPWDDWTPQPDGNVWNLDGELFPGVSNTVSGLGTEMGSADEDEDYDEDADDAPWFTPGNTAESIPQFKTHDTSDHVPQIYTIGELEGRPPVEFLIDKWIQHRTVSAVVGAPNAGKSAVMLDMLCSIAADDGDQFGVWKSTLVRHERVLYVAGEGVDGARNRVRAWEMAHGYSVRDRFHMTTEGFNFSSSESAWVKMAMQIKRGGYGVVVFDTLAKMMSGLEENSADDMGMVMSALQTLCDFTGAAVIVLHHTAKNSETFSPRGSSALTGAVASQVLIRAGDPAEYDEETNQMLRATGHKPIEVSVTKQKDADYVEPVSLTLVGAKVPPVVGQEPLDDFGRPIAPTAVLVGDAKGRVKPDIPVLQHSYTATSPTTDTVGLAEALVLRVVAEGAGPTSVRSRHSLTRTSLIEYLRRDNNPDHLDNREFGHAFMQAARLAFDAGAIVEDGNRLVPLIDHRTLESRDETRETLIARLHRHVSDNVEVEEEMPDTGQMGVATPEDSQAQ